MVRGCSSSTFDSKQRRRRRDLKSCTQSSMSLAGCFAPRTCTCPVSSIETYGSQRLTAARRAQKLTLQTSASGSHRGCSLLQSCRQPSAPASAAHPASRRTTQLSATPNRSVIEEGKFCRCAHGCRMLDAMPLQNTLKLWSGSNKDLSTLLVLLRKEMLDVAEHASEQCSRGDDAG